MKKEINQCPACQSEMHVVKYHCPKCQTEVCGNFKQNKFAKLSQDQQDFIETFVKKRGSIKEIEKEMGISYPTVRNKLDDVIEALGHQVERDYSRMEILNALNRGEIRAEEAVKLMDQLGDEIDD